MASVGAPASYKQPSRKGKKAWRKNVDITPVQAGLEDVREQITQTGGVVKEASNDALFAVDLKGSVAIAVKEKVTKKLKVDEILAARSAVPALEPRKRAATTDGLPPPKKVHHHKWITKKEVAEMKRVAYGQEKGMVGPPATGELYDPWAAGPASEKALLREKNGKELDFLEKQKPVKEPETLKHAPVSHARAGPVPAVRRPEEGISYNPEFAKWDALLQKEGAKAVEEEKARLAAEEEEERIRALGEVSDASSSEEDESESEDESEAEGDGETGQKSTGPRRKTTAERNRIKKHNELERLRAQQVKLKEQARELTLIKKYTKAAQLNEELRLKKLESKKIEDDLSNPQLMRKRRFGKAHLPREPLVLQLPDELSESLRTLKPEGNLIRERFRSLNERGILETRQYIPEHKKVKKTTVEKWSYKDFK